MTAVEYIEAIIYGDKEFSLSEAFEQAKEIEKQQIIEAHVEGFYSPPFGKSRNGEAEKYYNQTFKSE